MITRYLPATCFADDSKKWIEYRAISWYDTSVFVWASLDRYIMLFPASKHRTEGQFHE